MAGGTMAQRVGLFRGQWRVAAGVFAVLWPTTLAAQTRPELSLPLVCEPHKTCFIQSYVDLDSGPGVRDFACGGATYDKHSGVDFRILSAEAAKAGVPVLASADGTVKGLRDGVTDIFLRDAQKDGQAPEVTGRECGNGVVLDHGGGWETQYCHMKQGSVRVSKGQSVKRGERLGDIGFSGMADFAHVHLSVRHDGKIIDPFLPDAVDGACQRDGKGAGMWQPAAAASFPYRNGEIISAGFAGDAPDHNALERDNKQIVALTPASPALLFYARLINLRGGDRVHLVVTGPGGTLADQVSEPLERNKATYLSYAGKKRKDMPWAPGRYEGRAEIIRDGAVIATAVGSTELR